ncbi:Nose resistant to fluoxetine protein 5 [Trichuris trichiura]|uniref:Nose resistant to fluoxetine protein 5 n=1 Tax=Trichuris trichiura TaxID=36087 RepID=A0A077Z5D7_TRITR|nr:Nose resistant to fluoxetine protein 5 [Trichuris trichiura]
MLKLCAAYFLIAFSAATQKEGTLEIQNKSTHLPANLIVQTSQSALDEAATLLSNVLLVVVSNVTLPDVYTDQVNLTAAHVRRLQQAEVHLNAAEEKVGLDVTLNIGRAEVTAAYSLDMGLLVSNGVARVLAIGFELNLLFGAFLTANIGSLNGNLIFRLITPKEALQTMCGNVTFPNVSTSVNAAQKVPINFQLGILDEHVQFRTSDILWPLRFDVTYSDRISPLVPQPISIMPYSNMLTVYINENAVNAALHHIYQHDVATLEIQLDSKRLPPQLRLPSALLCWSCQVFIHFSLAEPPLYIISPGSSVFEINTILIVRVNSWLKRWTMLAAKSLLRVLVDLPLNDGQIELKMQLLEVRIQIEKMTFRKVIGKATKNFLEDIVRKRIWPALMGKAEKMLPTKKLSLEKSLCGFQIFNATVKMIDHAIMIGADFNVDHIGVATKLSSLLVTQ